MEMEVERKERKGKGAAKQKPQTKTEGPRVRETSSQACSEEQEQVSRTAHD